MVRLHPQHNIILVCLVFRNPRSTDKKYNKLVILLQSHTGGSTSITCEKMKSNITFQESTTDMSTNDSRDPRVPRDSMYTISTTEKVLEMIALVSIGSLSLVGNVGLWMVILGSRALRTTSNFLVLYQLGGSASLAHQYPDHRIFHRQRRRKWDLKHRMCHSWIHIHVHLRVQHRCAGFDQLQQIRVDLPPAKVSENIQHRELGTHDGR